jgi:cytochrome c-type biogenesis protein CcmF
LEIKFIGESLIFGKLGYLFSISAFIASIIAFIAYFISTQKTRKNEKNSWNNLGRIWFIIHSLSVIIVVFLLFYVLFSHRFEYEYVWKHSDKNLPWYYILSCFWEGQEGSFLLWSFWHVVLSIIILLKKDKFESAVMAIISIVQAILSSMTLGVFVFGYKLGSSPFMLLRESMPEAPIFNKANYLELINGNGLNPLLQNYWMVIHPPILFLGFAAIIIPFAYSIASLWNNDYKAITKPLLTWSLWALFILGTGILMGSAWAYEALSFGGYWAWDPVENASFVPWLTLAAGVHTVLIYKHSKHSLKASFSLFIISFFLVLYSTFLTRSGILGDTSVHSFTDLGMSGQLLVFLFTLTIPSVLLLLFRWRNIPSPRQEEPIQSREFWMFIGALIFTFSAMLISFTTSIPVWNYFLKFFHLKEMAPPLNVIEHYNKYQIVIAFFLAFGAGFVQFLRYKQNKTSNFLIPLIIPTIIAFIISGLIIWQSALYNWSYITLIILSSFTIFANLGYIISVIRGKIIASSGSITHLGFGIMLLGILISSAKKEVISFNTMGFDYGKGFSEKDKEENILLAKDLASPMGQLYTYL